MAKSKVENMDIHDLPTMLAMLKSMYGRFETNIKDAAKLEADASVRETLLLFVQDQIT